MPAQLLPFALLTCLVLLAPPGCRSGDGRVPGPLPPGAERPEGAPARSGPDEPELLRAALERRCPADAPAPPGIPCAEAARLYGPEPQLLWWRAEGPTMQARAVSAALRDAASRGLDPTHYAGGARAARPSPASAAAVRVTRDVALSLAALRFVSDLAVGRVVPQAAGFALVPEAEVHDVVTHVRALAEAREPEAVLTSIEPPFANYRRLRSALARYRRLAQQASPGLDLPERIVRPGEPLAEAPALRRRLVATGDLPEAVAQGPQGEARVLDPPLAAAVARFQARHGLTADGRIGPATAAALEVPLAVRARQIALALERFRWLPHRFPAPPIAVNIPEFRLHALVVDDRGYDRSDDALSMRVIVGEAWERQTPVFTGLLRRVVFWPSWDVPPRIAREELVPRILHDAETLAREQLEIVAGWGAAAEVRPPDPENLARLAAGALRLRQRPGPHNALGLVKFLFPNPYHVYLHGTPARALFARDRRDLSHGCIRVEDPLALARYVLRDEPGWTRERIVRALRGPQTQEVTLARPLPVYVLYATAVARSDGSVHFFPDVYGLDARLEALLERLPSGA